MHGLACVFVEVAHDDALSSLRLSLGVTTTGTDVDRALDVIPDLVRRLRA